KEFVTILLSKIDGWGIKNSNFLLPTFWRFGYLANSRDFRAMSSPDPLDSIRLNFSQSDLLLLNLALALIMYGVALDLRLADFRYLAKNPKGFLLGILSQIVLLPFLTWLLVKVISPPPSVALGMMLVA